MRQNLVRIEAAGSVGSGVLFGVPLTLRGKYNHCVLTAYHVIENAIKSGAQMLFQPESKRGTTWQIVKWDATHNAEHDHALVMFDCRDCMPPMKDYNILPPESNYVQGVEVGWLGYPNIHGRSDVACFSHGYISAYLESEEAYLVDGVSIHGMSGGPAFVCENDGSVVLAGIVTNYFANKRPEGAVLPGMAMFRTIKQIQKYYGIGKRSRD